jgi:hypothetical protein
MFSHFLNFISLPEIGQIQIAEPINFDQSSYKVKQDDKRFGRDVIIANEESELVFTRDYFEQIEMVQILPNGDRFNYASQGFDYLIDIFNNEGFEGKVEYILQKNDVSFVTGVFSYYTAVVEFDRITVKIIQNTNREIIKRLEDTDIDAFSNKALDGRDIVPCGTNDILLKAKPIIEISEWEMNQQRIITDFNIFANANPFMTLTRFEVSSSFVPLDEKVINSIEAINNFRYIRAISALSNGTGVIKCNVDLQYRPNGNNSAFASFRLILFKYTGEYNSGDPFELIEIYRKEFTGGSNVNFNVDTTFNFDLPNLNAGQNLSVFWVFSGVGGIGVQDDRIIFNQYNMKLQYTSTAIDTVVKGVRLIDVMKHNVKSLADVELIAPEYDLGGEHYNNFAFNGLLLGQITNKPFTNKLKDLMTVLNETCSDFQINENNIEILPYSEFYNDVEMAEFDELPSFESQSKFNKRYALKTAEFKYAKSSSERETNGQNSIDDVHTETQKFITDSVDGVLKVEVKAIRSAYLIENARKRAFDNEQTNSLQNDDNLFVLDCIPLAPNTQSGFGAVLLMRILDNGNLQILNNNSNGDGVPFNWTLLGFTVGASFEIVSGVNVGAYTVVSLTSSVVELDKVSGVPTITGDHFIEMRWTLNNVVWTNRTNEGFTSITGVDNPNDYSNLNYHWGRNIQRWYSYLATATKFKPNDVIKTTSFKVNGDLVTVKGGNTVSDSGDILNSEIRPLKILNPNEISVKVYADFETLTQLVSDIQTVKGYVTVNTASGKKVKGYVKDLDYVWISEELDMVLEEKFESDFMEITNEGVKAVGFDLKSGLNSFTINNNFVNLYDENENQMFAPTRFVNIKINGVAYTDVVLFSDALNTLINE